MEGGKELTIENLEEVLDGVRPFLKMTGGSIEIDQIANNPAQSLIVLNM